MESNERETILRELESNKLLRRLYNQHETLEKKLATFENRTFLTPNEEVERRLLKKKKLLGVDQMMKIVAELPASNSDQIPIQETA